VAIIFFHHFDPATGEELWVTSGGVTRLVKDINPGLRSARAISVGGMVRPIAFAALRLMTSSYFTGAWTGRSPGFSPLRMRSM
jgi:ELWxxDGT repeat protein